MREIASTVRTDWIRLVLLMILLALIGCQTVVESVETPSPSTATIAPISVALTPKAMAEPVKTVTATESPPTEDVKGAPSTGTAKPVSTALMPTATAEPVEAVAAAERAPTESKEGVVSVAISVVYDNNPYDPRLKTAWGFSCLVEIGETTILFDTGGDGATLLGNMATLGIDPQSIEIVVLSHIHGDHTGGLGALLGTGVRPTVYAPRSFPARFKADVRSLTALEEVVGPAEILSGVYTTGEVGSGIVEQALAVETSEGLVIITGCAHPGVVEMVRRARQVSEAEVYLVLGGFHLGGASQQRIERIIADFRALGVRRVAPCHCTGDKAMRAFADAFGSGFIQNGVGCVMTVDAPGK
jgi:7,8-dihydropterin-6-yl-methyl-4-(beta-D-ribofuranosyl)aminobenzene 5'-phosphate synthase